MTPNNITEKCKSIFTSFRLSARANHYLTAAASRSGRSKSKEASFRLEDHLLRFKHIETVSGYVIERGQGDD